MLNNAHEPVNMVQANNPQSGRCVSLYPADRRAKMLQALLENKTLSVEQLAEMFGVSKPTVRRDLKVLEEQGKIDTSYGCASARVDRPTEPLFSTRAVSLQAEKGAIARAAVEMIDEGDCVLLDAGTTVTKLAKLIADSNKSITVVTTAVNIACLVAPNKYVTTVLLGGILRDPNHSLIGEVAAKTLEQIHIRKAFVGAAGISKDAGITNFNMMEAELRRKIVTLSESFILLADHSKFGRKATVSFADISDVDVLISDSIPREYAALFEEMGTRLILAPVS